MESMARQQREYELVQLLLGDRAGFRAECTKALGLTPTEGLKRLDCDLIRDILDREYPQLQVQWCLPRGAHGPACL